eukprot:Gb_26563 [translate_table: standard]
MAEEDLWCLNKGPYLGDMSALCFIYAPWKSSIPYLLAGTGPQILLYDMETGKLLCSSHVFDGIRVHGIHSSCHSVEKCFRKSSTVRVAVFGERRVKLFDVKLNETSNITKQLKGRVDLDLLHILPKFGQWVMDVRFLKDFGVEEKDNVSVLAIGLSNNSVCLWDIARSHLVLELKCKERCLLYSMRMWGDSVETLRIASGTIYNEILIWKLASQQEVVGVITSEDLFGTSTAIKCKNEKSQNRKYDAILLNRLTGHEGSIFRIAWSHDGLKLISVSDDRSARLWTPDLTGVDDHDPWAISNVDIIAGPILYGHGARIWDCYISDVVIITASEDCTCCLWGLDGKHLATIKGHTGRGIWRCVYDPGTSILVTAGSDSAIKMRHLNTQAFRHLLYPTGNPNGMDDKMEVFKINVQRELSRGNQEFMDSKSEYVRCLCLARESCLYVATNLGYLHCIDLTVPGEERWTTVFEINGSEPIVCLDLLLLKSLDSAALQEDWVAVGDGKGRATVVQLLSSNLNHKMSLCFTWLAERERQLLGIYWCKSLGHRHVFTTDPQGGLKLWRLKQGPTETNGSCEMLGVGPSNENQASLVAKFTSSFLARIVCVDVGIDDELLVCGDQRGNLVVFSLPKSLLDLDDVIYQETFQTLCLFKGAHGISTVASISVGTSNGKQIHICSTGRDGCICSFMFDKDAIGGDSKILVFTGIKNVSGITVVEGVVSRQTIVGDTTQMKFAAGFTAVDFLLWDLTNDSELLRVSCGGWRRPHSFFIGDVPEVQNCFAYLKDHIIYVHRNWVLEDQMKLFPRYLHLQFHGREIHCVHFLPVPSRLISCQNDHCPKISWIATGSEDGTVRITRYSPNQMDKLNLSLPLGEHVGGSAVRSITTVSKVYALQSDKSSICHAGQGHLHCSIENRDTPLLLLSVGAKQVLTCWLLKWVEENQKFHESNKLHPASTSNGKKSSLEGGCTISFRWLSTYKQPRFHKPIKKMANGKQKCHTNGAIPLVVRSESVVEADLENDESGGAKVKLTTDDDTEDDWRYLAVTSFMVQLTDTGSAVCFVVTACSNATLSLCAFLLPEKLWFEVAVLDHERSPVLTLEHIVIPLCHPGSDDIQNIFLVFSGGTNGSITVWDLTEVINDFNLKIPFLNPRKDIVAQRRPHTGRGSQGGRRWRFLKKQSGISEVTSNNVGMENIDVCKNLSTTIPLERAQGVSQNPGVSSCEYEFSEVQDDTSTGQTKLESLKESESSCLEDLAGGPTNMETSHSNEVAFMRRLRTDIPTVYPMHIFYSAHQSGVNCLHISSINGSKCPDTETSGLLYCVISGGDDQALHIASFSVHVLQIDLRDNQLMNNLPSNERNDVRTYGKGSSCELLKPNIVNTILAGSHGKPLDGISGHKGEKFVYGFTCLNREMVHCAHSSSIKGVWTDGQWAFSTGLDQRVRCWHLFPSDRSCHLREHCCSILNVPEPEALHAMASKERNHYQIAVVGRGLQIVEFSNSGHHGACEDAEL